MRFFPVLLFLVLFISSDGHSQKRLNEDSLLAVFNNSALPDTIRINAIHDLAWQKNFTDPDSGLALAKIQLQFAEKRGSLKGQANAYNTMGVACINKDDLDNALIYHTHAYEIRKKLKDKKGQAVSLNNIGIVHNYKGDIVSSIDYYQKSLRLKEEIGDMPGVAAAYSNLGQIYSNEALNEKALSYFLASLRIRDSLHDERGLEDSYLKIASYYGNLKQYETAIDYTHKSIVYSKSLNHKKILANNYENLGLSYREINQLDSAEKYYNLSMELRVVMEDLEGLSDSYCGLGVVRLKQKKFGEAITYCKKAFDFANESGYPEVEEDACDCLTKAYEGAGDSRNALLFLHRFNTLNDSLNSLEKAKSISRKIFQFEFEKRAFADSLRIAKVNEVKDVKRAEEVRQQQMYTAAGVLGFIMMVIIAFILFRGYRQKQKNNEALEVKNTIITEQKYEVENQKALVDEKNKAILDSINYAKSLQLAILPSEKLWNEVFAESFILYLPKDIVAGDFYWVESSGDEILFAVADCTGHGVPGALVSVVCCNALNRSVKEFNLRDPGKILDKVSELVLETFAKSEKEVSDGMDISLCVIDKKTLSVKWAGANNPIWFLSGGKMNELTANKQPIGRSDNPVPFKTHTIQLAKGDSIYLFTDGFPDQFGGEKGKKFKYRPFQEYLFVNSSQSMQEQKTNLFQTFETWRGLLEQIDDVCVVGIRIG